MVEKEELKGRWLGPKPSNNDTAAVESAIEDTEKGIVTWLSVGTKFAVFTTTLSVDQQVL